MNIARVFKSGNSQAVRLPKQFRVDATELEILRRGEEIVLRPAHKGMAEAFELLAQMPQDAIDAAREPLAHQERPGL